MARHSGLRGGCVRPGGNGFARRGDPRRTQAGSHGRMAALEKETPPELAVQVKLHGKAAEETAPSGEVDIETALDKSGTPLDCPSGGPGMDDRFFDNDGFDLTIDLPAPPSLRLIRQLRGTFALQTGGRSETVAVKDFLKNQRTRADPRRRAEGEGDCREGRASEEHRPGVRRRRGPGHRLGLETHRSRWLRYPRRTRRPLKSGNSSGPGDPAKVVAFVAFLSRSRPRNGPTPAHRAEKHPQDSRALRADEHQGSADGEAARRRSGYKPLTMPAPAENRRRDIFTDLACRLSFTAILIALPAFLYAAEKPAPPSSGTIADFTATARAEWRRSLSSTDPVLAVVVRLRGPVIARTSALGELKLESVLDERGRCYRWQCVSAWAGGLMNIHFGERCPKDGEAEFEIDLPYEPAIRVLRELRGSLSLLTAGESKTVTVPNAFRHLGKPIKTSDLHVLGIEQVAVTRQPKSKWPKDPQVKDSLAIRAALSANAISNCELIGADGRLIGKAICRPGRTSAGTGVGGVWWKLVSEVMSLDDTADERTQRVALRLDAGFDVPEDAKLRLTVDKDRMVRVPFA